MTCLVLINYNSLIFVTGAIKNVRNSDAVNKMNGIMLYNKSKFYLWGICK
jgi:hypothetical protein